MNDNTLLSHQVLFVVQWLPEVHTAQALAV